VSIVVACTHDGGFASNNTIPWHIKTDLSFFRTLTSQTSDPHRKNAVIMGRATWESLPASARPLPNRHNIVVTSTLSIPDEIRLDLASSLEEALKLAHVLDSVESIFIIGGQQLYEAAISLPHVSTVYLTFVSPASPDVTIPPCDRHFPLSQLYKQFRITSQTPAEDGPYRLKFMRFDRAN